ncbi:MAG: flagellar motor protein [Azovibrio sp.]|nr:flagellar motor protein [Azovibrio sp.]
MDKISLLGLVVGVGAILTGQVLEGGHIASLAQPTALMIVLGGTLGAVMLQSPFDTFKRGLKMLKWVFVPPRVDHKKLIDQISQWSHVSRREGLLALENFTLQIKDPFLQKGLQLLVDGADPARLREVLEVEITTYEEHMRQGARVWESAGGYAPTIGILGAVMGLIHVMENLSDPSKLGAGIAVAFVATIYGVGLANLVFLPVANKLKAYIARQVVEKEMLLDGLTGIAVGDNPRIIESRLQGYAFQEPGAASMSRAGRR